MQRRIAVLFLLLPFFDSTPAAGQDASCTRARSIVEQVAALYRMGDPDHAHILGLLATARNLCPSLGEAWRYTYCSALASGDRKAGFYKDQAIFNGVADLSCPGGPAPPRPRPGFVRQKYALIIGIGHFQDQSIPTLSFAGKDAADLAAFLRSPRWGSDFREKLALLKARRKVLLLDTCYSGQLEKGQRSLVVEGGITPEQAQLFLSGEGTYVITSSSARERSWESEQLQNGFFTHFLIEALKQGQGNEPPTIRQVFEYLAPRVREAVARDKTAAQNPQLFPRDSSEDLRQERLLVVFSPAQASMAALRLADQESGPKILALARERLGSKGLIVEAEDTVAEERALYTVSLDGSPVIQEIVLTHN